MAGYAAASMAHSSLDWVMGKSTGLESEWARKSAAGDPAPRATYLALYVQAITDAQTAMATIAPWEVSGTGYARQRVLWSAASARRVGNSDMITFGPFADASGLSAPVVSACLVTTLTGSLGLVLANWTLPAPITTVQNQALQIAADSLGLTLAVS